MRSPAEIVRFAAAQPDDALVAVSTAEALQFGPWMTGFLLGDPTVLRVYGRPCLVVDLPPVEMSSPN